MSDYQFTYQTEDPIEVQLLVSMVCQAFNSRGVGTPLAMAMEPVMGQLGIPILMKQLGPEKCMAILSTWAQSGTAAWEHEQRKQVEG